MIITLFKGGLGNQMFQYAIGRSLAHKLGVPLKLDTGYYEKDFKRKYLLDNFSISAQVAGSEEIEKIKNKNIFQKIFGSESKKVFVEPYFNFCPQVLSLPDNTYLDGFWQSEKYFKDIEDIIQREFVLRNPLPPEARDLVNLINEENSVSIHIRRGDYVLPKYKKIFYECTSEYYNDAISTVNKETSNPYFFVFSDDIDWAKTLNLPQNTIFVGPEWKLQDYEEFAIMSICKHNITANSTFSWWAGWLNKNPKKILITPKKWFVDGKNEGDLIPETWIKI